MDLELHYRHAAQMIRRADALLIGAGAGMGVDSGLPDFRGNEGFWKAYPAFRGKSFVEMANPLWFQRDPPQAWGFYGHRLNLYRRTEPHEGFSILQRWAERLPGGWFVFTSNVDGQFQKAGFTEDRIFECHGSIHVLQCAGPCSERLWSASEVELVIYEETCRASFPLPRCLVCGGMARPNVLMFGDAAWVDQRSDEQRRRYRQWRQAVHGKRVVAIEIGAGTAIPTVRFECARAVEALIRINPREPETTRGLSIPVAALEALQGINRYINAAPASE